MFFWLRSLSPSLALLIICFLLCTQTKPAYGKEVNSGDELHGDQQKQNTFSVLACVTWWSHDAVGYHPAMSLFLENTSGHQIVGGEIPFQGRFTDVRTGEVTVAREYRRAPIRDHERISVFLRGPKYYELPIDTASWPTIECKAMCRLNNTNVEDLFIVHLAKVSMTDEDAQAQLVSQAGRSPLLIHGKVNDKINEKMAIHPQSDDLKDTAESALPLHAMPDSIPDASLKHMVTKKDLAEPIKIASNTKSVDKNFYPKNLPGVGSDFYAFDKLFGAAVEVQSGTGGEDLTWTRYKSEGLIKELFVGSRNANKADIIIIVMDRILKEKELRPLAKLLSNCSKSISIVPFTHSVKYLAAGRYEIMTTVFKENRVLSLQTLRGGSSRTVIVASRLPGDIETALSKYSHRVNFLKFLEL